MASGNEPDLLQTIVDLRARQLASISEIARLVKENEELKNILAARSIEMQHLENEVRRLRNLPEPIACDEPFPAGMTGAEQWDPPETQPSDDPPGPALLGDGVPFVPGMPLFSHNGLKASPQWDQAVPVHEHGFWEMKLRDDCYLPLEYFFSSPRNP